MLVYFARPIDQAESRGINTVALRIETALKSIGISTFRPHRAFTIADHPISDLGIVDAINRSALGHSDAVVAYLPVGVATLGVPAEIELALNTNKPVVILTDQPLIDKSVQVWNWRERGASVLVWSPGLAAEWAARSNALTDLLVQAPYGQSPKLTAPVPESERTYQQVTFGTEGASVVSSPIPWKADDSDEEPCPLPMYTDGKARQEITGAFYPNPGAALHVHLADGATLPARGHVGDAGIDLAISEEMEIHPGETKLVRTGVTAALPVGWWGLIVGRSSAYAKFNLDIRLGVIDEGYRGELMLRVTNKGTQTRTFSPGARLAQYVLIPTWQGDVIQAQERGDLPDPRGRGEAGWGSTGGHE